MDKRITERVSDGEGEGEGVKKRVFILSPVSPSSGLMYLTGAGALKAIK